MKKHVKFWAIFCAAAMTFSMSSFAAAAEEESETETVSESTEETPTLDAIRERGKLVVGTSADYAPYEFHTEIDGEDTIVGFEMAYARYIADSLEVELEIVDMPFDSLIISLQQGDFDLVMAGMAKTDERAEAVDFSDVFFCNNEMLIVRKGEEEQYQVPEDLIGHKVGAQTGSMQMNELKEIIGEEDAIGLTRNQDLIMELKAGKIDAIYSNDISALPYVNANEDLSMVDVGLPSDPGFNACAKKGSEDLIAYVNDIIAELNETGLMEQYVIEAQELAGIE